MKTIRKLITGLLVLTMVLGMGIAAYAAEGSITITGAKAKETYDAYRVFDYVPANESDVAAGGVYKLAPKFAGFENYTYNYKDSNNDPQSINMSAFFTIGQNDILDTKGITDATAAALFGKAAVQYAKDNGIANDGSATPDADGNATINVSEYGYYVIDSTLGTAVAVDTNTPNVTFQEKNKETTVDKKITGATYEPTIYDEKGNRVQIGDRVDFEVTADLKTGGEEYKLADGVTEGITIDFDTIQVTFSDDKYALPYTGPSAYTFTSKDGTEKNGFLIEFDGEPVSDVTVTVTYSGYINADAVIASNTNINEAYVKYGQGQETEHITTHTDTYPVKIKKIALNDPDAKLLPGAKFQVIRESDKSVVKFKKISDTEYKVDPEGTETEFVTVAAEEILLEGLNTESYVLVETEAPTGYNLLESSVDVNGETFDHAQEFVVSADSTIEVPQIVTVEDGTGITLPSTGGIGTTIFYIVGGILIVAGIAYFIVRRKADAE